MRAAGAEEALSLSFLLLHARVSQNLLQKKSHSSCTLSPHLSNFQPSNNQTGKVIDIAIAFVVGAAFTDLIKTFVSSFVTPLLAAIGSKSFNSLFFTVRGQKIAYGERAFSFS